jgi:hypothetical protein
MDLSRRAKIFLPFNALEGLCEELNKKEKISSPRRILSEDEKDALDETFSRLEPGQMVRISYYSVTVQDGVKCAGYASLKGRLTKIDLDHRALEVIRTVIPIRDISRIELVDKSEAPFFAS